ncbi:hypothetical protein [Lacticaseibacillus mingshuiensis]|uniref:ABC transporter permease n=1 Tax=Lacticaseibacillus mingshuiensis TaxID=2799574 RepID=A0ABW4CIS2_9LACO|nr:hypothetical protein [Lacticaseibacillus mingshuiensis]
MKLKTLTRIQLQTILPGALIYWGVILVLTAGLNLLLTKVGGAVSGGTLISLNAVYLLIICRHVNGWADFGFQNGLSRRNMWLATLMTWVLQTALLVAGQTLWNLVMSLQAGSAFGHGWWQSMMLIELGYKGTLGAPAVLATILFEMLLLGVFFQLGQLIALGTRANLAASVGVVVALVIAIAVLINRTTAFWANNDNALALFVRRLMNGGTTGSPWLAVLTLLVLDALLAAGAGLIYRRLRVR